MLQEFLSWVWLEGVRTPAGVVNRREKGIPDSLQALGFRGGGEAVLLHS